MMASAIGRPSVPARTIEFGVPQTVGPYRVGRTEHSDGTAELDSWVTPAITARTISGAEAAMSGRVVLPHPIHVKTKPICQACFLHHLTKPFTRCCGRVVDLRKSRQPHFHLPQVTQSGEPRIAGRTASAFPVRHCSEASSTHGG